MAHAGEEQLWVELRDERNALLSAAPAEARGRRLALGVLAVSLVVFAAAAPFAKTPLAPLPAFLPAYEAALVLNDLVTAVLLFGQFAIVRRTGLLFLAGAYLFSALMAVAHGISFPGVLALAGALAPGPQTTAWLYFLWHGGFPLLVAAYALLPAARPVRGSAAAAIGLAAGGVLLLALACWLVTTLGHGLMPAIMDGDRDAPAKVAVATASWILCVGALALLWRRRPHSVLDLWLMVALCTWIFDIALAAVLNGGRYDLGWYAGRVYGLLGASFVLMVLLLENSVLYARLLEAYGGERRERQRVQEKTAELAAANKELDAFTYSVSHDLRAPLRHIGGYAQMLQEDCAAMLGDAGRRHLQVIGDSVKKMGALIEDLLEMSRLGRQPLAKQTVDIAALVRQVLAECAAQGRSVEVVVGELPEALADAALIRQVWVNLVSNAFKYSSKRADARVEIGARRDGPDLVYFVRDNGAGFDMKYADRLFGVFQRLHRAEDFPGTGVGLAIAQRIVARHGGRIWAESEPGAGATFSFTL
ncbi:MAG TPA: MASE4 domain-containing protein [Burkholderiales bacterium]|nr:MASE4 domain-containing protein [Burkholderiales bacterium]